jgi:hypothetical protein
MKGSQTKTLTGLRGVPAIELSFWTEDIPLRGSLSHQGGCPRNIAAGT